MREYFEYVFVGTKEVTDELVSYIYGEKKGNEAYEFLNNFLIKPYGYDELDDKETTALTSESAEGFVEVGEMDIEVIIKELTEKFSVLTVTGECYNPDENIKMVFCSKEGDKNLTGIITPVKKACAFCGKDLSQQKEFYVDNRDVFCDKECFKNYLLQDDFREEEDENEDPFPGMSKDEINDML